MHPAVAWLTMEHHAHPTPGSHPPAPIHPDGARARTTRAARSRLHRDRASTGLSSTPRSSSARASRGGLTLWDERPAHLAGSAWARAEHLATTSRVPGPALVLCHLSAAWIHTGGVRPSVMHTCPRPGGQGRGTHRFVLRDEDTERVGALHVTTRARTVYDVIRSGQPGDLGVARALLRAPGLSSARDAAAPPRRTAELVAQVEAICDRTMPGSTRVRRVLDMLVASID